MEWLYEEPEEYFSPSPPQDEQLEVVVFFPVPLQLLQEVVFEPLPLQLLQEVVELLEPLPPQLLHVIG